MNINEHEVPKHLKKKDSNTSDAKRKSNHKHDYIKSVVVANERNMITGKHSLHHYLSDVCSICGKIMNVTYWVCDPIPNGKYRHITEEEFEERYGDLPHYKIDSIFKTTHVNLEEDKYEL